jgi:hypothetical protein
MEGRSWYVMKDIRETEDDILPSISITIAFTQPVLHQVLLKLPRTFHPQPISPFSPDTSA